MNGNDAAAAARLLQDAFFAAVGAVQPATVMPGHLPPAPSGRLVVVGAGKAAAAMAQVVERHYGGVVEGLVITSRGQALPTRSIRVVEAGHPLPDAAGVAATAEIVRLLGGLGEDDLVLCLVSGGGSALLEAPVGIGLGELTQLTRDLLRSGADIGELNLVRKHLSAVKGGRLAAAAFPARVVALILSDVPGDDLSAVASGPTVPDPSTFQDALGVLDRYAILAPDARAQLERGRAGAAAETPKPGDPRLGRVENVLIGGAQLMLEAAAAHFAARGVTPLILSESVVGEAREAARFHAAVARQVVGHGQPVPPPCVLISGGETTVTVRGAGRGGRNAEFALAMALELRGLPGVHALAADSDGKDGSEDNAGALVAPTTLAAVGRRRAERYLADNDSYGFFAAAGGLFVSGPTHTNVSDLRLILCT